MTRLIVEVEGLGLLRDCVQLAESPAVVVFVVAFDEPLRQAIEEPRTSVDRCQLVSHVHSSRLPAMGWSEVGRPPVTWRRPFSAADSQRVVVTVTSARARDRSTSDRIARAKTQFARPTIVIPTTVARHAVAATFVSTARFR